MNPDLIKYALLNVKKRKLRSSLTVLSILIGVTAIYALVSFGVGLQNYIDVLASEAGVDKMFLQARGIGAPGMDKSFFLSKEDLDLVEKINGVQEMSALYSQTAQVRKDRQVKFVFIFGLDTDHLDLIHQAFAVDVEVGRRLKEGDLDKVLLGYNYQLENRIFEEPVSLGEKIEIKGKKFEVIGFQEAVGNPQDDSNIFMTYEAFEAMFPADKDKFGWAIIQANKNVDVSLLAERIGDRLRRHKGQEEGKEDFFVQTFEDALATFNNIIGVLNGILVLIALISVVVAGINTTNTMYTAVLERTKEIGVMKAVGARNSSILFVFVIESGLVGMVGGIIGVLLGFLISSAGGAIAAAGGFGFLSPAFPWWLTLGCIMFAFCVGALAGLMPAYRASKLKPVDALRYE
jgi:putative ABC transport system permease protein